MEQKDSDDDSDLEIIDVDLSIDVNKMEASQVSFTVPLLVYTLLYKNTLNFIFLPPLLKRI